MLTFVNIDDFQLAIIGPSSLAVSRLRIAMEPVTLILILTALLPIAGAAVVWVNKRNTAAEETSYVLRRPLKSYEQTLYWRLVKTLPEHVVLPQIPMNRCVGIKGRNATILARESLDFVICNSALRVVAVIEIEDEKRPLSDYRLKVEWLKEEALEAAGIRLVKCSPTGLLSEGYIAMEFRNDPASLMAA